MAACPREGGRDGGRDAHRQAATGTSCPGAAGHKIASPQGLRQFPGRVWGRGVWGGCWASPRRRLATLGVCRSVKFLFFLFSASADFISGVDGVCSTTFARAHQQIQQTCTTYIKYKKVHGRFGVPHTSNPLEIRNYSLLLIRAAFCHGKIKHNSTAPEHGSFGNSNLLLHFSVHRDLLLSFTTNSTLKHFIRSGVI